MAHDNDAILAGLPPEYPADAKRLGAPLFRINRHIGTMDILKLGLLCLAAAAVGGFGLIFSLLRIKNFFFHREGNFAPGAGFPWPNLCCLPIAAPLLLGCGYIGFKWLFQAMREAKSYVVVYGAGFVLFNGIRFRIWRWADIVRVNMQNVDFRQFVYFIQTSQVYMKYYRVENAHGDVYEFWSTQDARGTEFGQMIESQTYPLLSSAAKAQLKAGGAVDFGPFRIDAKGLTHAGEFTRWADVGPVTFHQGNVLIGRRNAGEAKASLKKVDNHHVFFGLLSETFRVPFPE